MNTRKSSGTPHNYIDFETFNEVPIKHGTYKYTSTCEPIICTYAFGAGEVMVWDITADPRIPDDLAYMLEDPTEIWTAHSSMFDRNVLRYRLGHDIAIPRWRDTMVKALAHGLPGGRDILCQILHVDEELAKQGKRGKQLINLFCKPMQKNSKLRRATRLTHPAEWAEFLEYARRDTAAMREVDRKLPDWNYRGAELENWFLDQRMNDRGIYVDVPFANAAITAAKREQTRLKDTAHDATNGAVASLTKRDELLAHLLAEYGVDLPDLQKATLERRIADDNLPVELRELLAMRLAAATASTSKYTALVNGVMPDNRLRGTHQFDGAARTRRWAHRQFQPGNLPRPDMEARDIDFGIEAIIVGAEDVLFDDVMRVLRNTVRGCIVASPGHKKVIADLANIEGRLGAWTTGETWKLQAFRDFDAGLGPDLYKVAYARSFNIPHQEVGKAERQIGKVEELMLQYQGGVGAFITGAETYGIDLEAMSRAVLPVLPSEVIREARGLWDWMHKKRRSTYGLQQDVYVACDGIKRVWRGAHVMIESFWTDIENAARAAILNPGETFTCRMFKLRRSGAWLRILLPSGNYLCYPSPQVDDKGRISYMGINQYTRKWTRISTYGGKFLENICQGLAGDVLKSALPEMEAAEYLPEVLIHDEAVTETPDTKDFTVEALCVMLAREREWTVGLPLAAAGFETYRYRKD